MRVRAELRPSAFCRDLSQALTADLTRGASGARARGESSRRRVSGVEGEGGSGAGPRVVSRNPSLRGRGRRRSNDDYPNLGGSFQLRQTALNAGYNEGIKEGRKDRSKNRRYSARDFSAYRNATKDYSSRYGDRELYRQYFRMAFENGYDAGYNGY